jgi:hypothetical protein
MTSALDTLHDPLITTLLALSKDAINADVALEADPAATPEAAVATTAPHPIPIEIIGETAMPILACYRVRSRAARRSLHLYDHTQTLQWIYVSPSTAREQLPMRWPLLEHVWQALFGAVTTGAHPAHADGAQVLAPLGVIEMPLPRILKREFFYDAGDYAYPAFVAELDVVVQDDSALDTSGLYPALSFQTNIWIGDITALPPDVSVISYPSPTPTPISTP